MAQKECCLAVDIGGTKIEVGLFAPSGEMLSQSKRFSVQFNNKKQADIYHLATATKDYLRKEKQVGWKLVGIGISVCGHVDEKGTAVVLAPNLGWRDYAAGEILDRIFHLPIHMEVDTAMAATAEMMWGAARNVKHFAWCTIGTGRGSYYVLDGKLFGGAHGFAGEIGHITIDERNGYPCGCGRRGCLETYITGPAIARAGQEAVKRGESDMMKEMAGESEITARVVIQAMQKKDPAACRIIDEKINMIAKVMGGLANTLDLEMIIIGGGVASAIPGFIEIIQERSRDYLMFEEAKKELRIAGETFSNAALYGAAANFFIKEGVLSNV